jgi:hypothetical protein
MKKSGKLAYHVVNSNNAVNIEENSIENNYVLSVSGEDLYHRFYVRTMSEHDIDAVFANSYCFQIIGLSQDGACTDIFENLSVNSIKRDLSNDVTFKFQPTS